MASSHILNLLALVEEQYFVNLLDSKFYQYKYIITYIP